MWEEQMLSKVVQQLHTHHTNSNYKKLPLFVSRSRHSIDHCIDVELLLIKFNVALTEPKTMSTKEDSPLFWLHYKARLGVCSQQPGWLKLGDSHTLALTFRINWQGGSHGHS
jgi:hypothetical protein